MQRDPVRLGRLMHALHLVTQRPVPHAGFTLGDLGLDSRHLVELMVACDEIYGTAVAFEMLDITIDTSVGALHGQILDSLTS